MANTSRTLTLSHMKDQSLSGGVATSKILKNGPTDSHQGSTHRTLFAPQKTEVISVFKGENAPTDSGNTM